MITHGTKDVTNVIRALYDVAVNSPSFGSGFLDVEECAAIEVVRGLIDAPPLDFSPMATVTKEDDVPYPKDPYPTALMEWQAARQRKAKARILAQIHARAAAMRAELDGRA